jgi:hypothetical protein
MAVNLTHGIAANVTLTQASSQNSNIIAFASGAVVALIVAIIGAYVNYIVAKRTIDASVRNTDKTINATLEATNKTINTTLEATKETIASTIQNANNAIEHDKFRMKENERQEKAKVLRDERKQAYIQFIKYVVKTDIGNRSRRDPAIDVEKYVDEYAGAIAALKLLSPKIADLIIYMHQKYLLEDETKFTEEWGKLSNELYTEIIPKMKDELDKG